MLRKKLQNSGEGLWAPVDEQEEKEVENDCRAMMERIYEFYKEADKGTASNVVLTDETILELQKKLMGNRISGCYIGNPIQIWKIMKAWILFFLRLLHLGKAVL